MNGVNGSALAVDTNNVKRNNGYHGSIKEVRSDIDSPSLLSQSLQQNQNGGAPPFHQVAPQSPPRLERKPISHQHSEPSSSKSYLPARYAIQSAEVPSSDGTPPPKSFSGKLSESSSSSAAAAAWQRDSWLTTTSDATVPTSNILSFRKEEEVEQTSAIKGEQIGALSSSSPPLSTRMMHYPPNMNDGTSKETDDNTSMAHRHRNELIPSSPSSQPIDNSTISRRNIIGQTKYYEPIRDNHQQHEVYYTFGDASVSFPSRVLLTPSRPQDEKRTFQQSQTILSNYWSHSIHAQSLLLGIAFMAIWTPNNAMAPNLTAMASDFGMTSDYERDLFLGSYISLALGVFCLPISALLGFMADFYSRKYLFLACVVGGSLSTLWTANAQTFVSLFLSRLSCGGCMSASVPVAFSLLGDLFAVEERNAASSGLTSMMGLGIILGQVYAGTVGPQLGWPHVFVMSCLLQAITALFVLLWVQEPTRGGKEKALQDMISSGKTYDRQLTLRGFLHAMQHNRSNSILLWQGFFTSLPWGIIFCFLNDFLSQEKGFSVPDATLLVMLFGVGCAIGGIAGGYVGQICLQYDRKYLPYFMAASTAFGILPFIALLETNFENDTPYSNGANVGYLAMSYAILCGTVASLPSVNVRPCIINVNPPETRGAALTASNLFITLGRGIGPSCITLLGSMGLSRETSFDWTLTIFWIITAGQLLLLAQTLPKDQDDMEAELARYAAMHTSEVSMSEDGSSGSGSSASMASTSTDEEGGTALENEVTKLKSLQQKQQHNQIGTTEADALVSKVPAPQRSRRQRSPLRSIFGDNGKRPHRTNRHHSSPRRHGHRHRTNRPPFANSPYRSMEDPSMSSMEEYMTSVNTFDGLAARQSLQFVSQGIRELKEEISLFGSACGPHVCGPSDLAHAISEEDDDEDFRSALTRNDIHEPESVDLRLPPFGERHRGGDGNISVKDLDRRQEVWKLHRKEQLGKEVDERTKLLS